MFIVVKAASRRALQKIAALLVIAVVTLVGLSIGGSVSAHTGFAGSTPSNGEVVDNPVTLVTLVFTGESEEAGEGFVVLDASGQVRAPIAVSTLDNKVFTLTFDPPLAGGEIGVKWTVRAPDAHPVEGAFSFTVTAPSSAGAVPATVPAITIDASTTATTGMDMSQMSSADMMSMDEFLAVESARPGESQATIGRLISFAGIALAIGGMYFARTTLRGSSTEIRSLVNAVKIVGGTITIGAAIEYGGVARIADEPLLGYWTSSSGFATVLRMLAGVAIAAGLAATTVRIRPSRKPKPLSSAPNTTGGADKTRGGPSAGTNGFTDPGLFLARQQAAAHTVDRPAEPTTQLPRQSTTKPLQPRQASTDEKNQAADGPRNQSPEPLRRWVADRSSALAFVGCGAAVISFWFDGHTVSKGFRPLHAIANSVHVVAGSVWMGGVVAMAAVVWMRHRRGVPPRALELVVRFSSVAAVALGAVIVAGLIMAVSVLDSVGELTGTEWGQVLLLKTAAAVLAIGGGAYNHFRLLPALDADPDDPMLHEQLRSVITAEAIMLCFVVVVTAWLVSSAS
ncbi:copper resistance CopC/CopD family protein [Ilumatobacter sp.]|uniref:copper resistance CopC/CopD family protein n=1 Tax=Ilumatobacter sp. TaxID=1967498 RepID=UPI003753A4B2